MHAVSRHSSLMIGTHQVKGLPRVINFYFGTYWLD